MTKKNLFFVLLSSGLILGSSFSSYAGQWKLDDVGWWYQNDDGSYGTNSWENIEGKWYYFDNSGYMAANAWVGNYYLGSDGAMLTNTTTPDGYRVGADGAWIPDGKSEIQQYKEIIDSHGYDSYYGHSNLTFDIQSNTLTDHGDHYQVEAIYHKVLTAPGNLKVGDEISLVLDDLTGETKTFVHKNGGLCLKGSSYPTYQYSYTGSAAPVELQRMYDEDSVTKPMCKGKLFILKNATDEIAIINEVRNVTPEKLNSGIGYNGVYFDENGYVTRLVIYGA